MGIEPDDVSLDPPRVTSRLDRLFERYPQLSPLKGSVQSAYETIRDAYRRGGKLLVCGNGGSCADAQHIVGELMKGFYLKRPLPDGEQSALAKAFGDGGEELAGMMQGALPAIALGEHAALNTAFANDVDASLMFAQQVIGYGRPGDALLSISTSGGSLNVLRAAQAARARGLRVIALTGGDGGKLASIADTAIIVPASITAQVQEYHLPIYHTLCAMLEERFFGRGD
ncbi:MAG: SIS domain-containing protein [Oscillospiraceae bacterium]|nr:SIS domain-containing protein [Oscillospiraceae bacterium]